MYDVSIFVYNRKYKCISYIINFIYNAYKIYKYIKKCTLASYKQP